jgi:glucan phosphoethanolaminetransferase (alkaline phosphatase superfamily)
MVQTIPSKAPGNEIANELPAILLEIAIFCIPVLIFTAALKFALLRESGDISPEMRLHYIRMYAGEFWESLVLLPVAMTLVGWFAAHRWRKWIYFVITESLLLDAAVQWATFRTMGEFPNRELASDFFNTLRSNPAFLTPGNLLDRKERIVFLAAVFGGIVPLVVSFCSLKYIRRSWMKHHKWALGVVTVILFLVGLFPMGVAGANMERAGVLERTACEIFKADESEEVFGPSELLKSPKQVYEEDSFPDGAFPDKADSKVREPAWVRSATNRGASPNVIFVVLETTGSKDYPLEGSDSNMPRVSALSSHALVAERQYSTDIESLRANFSIYASLYDLPGQGHAQYFGRHLLDGPVKPLDALPRILAQRRYATRYYFPFLLWPKVFEEDLLYLYGFQSIRMGYNLPVSKDPQEELAQWNRLTVLSSPAEKMQAERNMYEMAMSDLSEFHAKGQPFFLAITGSIGHAPFSDIRPAEEVARDPNPSRKVLIDNIARFQDELIGNLVDKLKRLDILDNTIFLITGDHGPRTRLDDPSLDLIYASDESYHVPLLIHYPALFQKTVRLDRTTSHVDITPTILDIMGLGSDRYLQEGMSMLDPAIDDRITFFLGQHLRGFDSVYYRDKYLMYSYDRETAYLNTSFRFSQQNQINISAADPDVKHMYRALVDLRRVQQFWIAYLRHP